MAEVAQSGVKTRPMTAADARLFYPLRFLETENAVRRALRMPEVRIVDGVLHLVVAS